MKVGQRSKNAPYLYTEAKLFAGTVRDNIDPTETRKVDLLVNALQWLRIMEVLDPQQKVLDCFEASDSLDCTFSLIWSPMFTKHNVFTCFAPP